MGNLSQEDKYVNCRCNCKQHQGDMYVYESVEFDILHTGSQRHVRMILCELGAKLRYGAVYLSKRIK